MKRSKEKTNHIPILIISTLLFLAVLFVCFFLPLNSFGAIANSSFEEQLAQFPESYHAGLRQIHSIYPNYSFQADYVNTTFEDAVYQETLYHRKLVNLGYDGVSWRSLSPSCYNATTGTWYNFSGNWTDAGVDVIEYYMDPRNFLDTQSMYMFAQQTYTGNEKRSCVNRIVAGSFLAGTYSDSTGKHSYVNAIMKAAKNSKVSPYVIAAILRIEQPSGGDSPLIDGSRGYYNFFNFGAAGGDVVGNGIAFAKSQGWDNVYKSIVGGAKLYYRDYLQYGQDTYYYKDFNVVNGNYDHQYAQGVYSPISSAVFLKNALSQDTSASLHLRIPVFREMPVQACPYPPKTDYYNPRYLPGVTKTGWVYKDGVWYYIKNNGTKKCGWLQDGGATYYLDSNGVMKTGWIFVNGYWYYMNTSGAMQTGWLDEGQNRYFLTPSGAMATGWVKDGGKWYYMNASGQMQKRGWIEVNGNKYFLNASGQMKTGWMTRNNKRYYLTPSGAMAKGWTKIKNKWYFMNMSGVMQTGWIKVNGNSYYLNRSGVMQTGWIQLGNKWYYLAASGAMQTGWLKLGNTWYYMNNSGVMQTGWINSGGNWYYLKPTGAMAANEWLSGYWFSSGGAWTYQAVGKWSKDETGWQFGDSYGWQANNETVRINGADYTFNEYGYWIN